MASTNLSRVSNRFQTSTRGMMDIAPESFPETTRIFVVSEPDSSLAGLARLLEARDENTLVACVGPGDDCLERLAVTRPDALLIQIKSPTQPVEEFIREVQHRVPGIRMLLLGTAMDDEYLYRLVRAGVQGYINGPADADHIRYVLGQVLRGHSWVERRILQRFVTARQRFDTRLAAEIDARIERLSEHLTRRELQILCEVIKGLAIKQIAERVHLSHQGVKMHLAKLFRKFNVTNRNQLIIAAFDEMSPARDLSVLLQNGLNTQLQRQHRRNKY